MLGNELAIDTPGTKLQVILITLLGARSAICFSIMLNFVNCSSLEILLV